MKTGATGAACRVRQQESMSTMEKNMIAKKILISATAATMAFAPVAASAAPVAVERQTATSEETSELGGAGLIIAILAGLTVIGGIIAAASDDDDPVSV